MPSPEAPSKLEVEVAPATMAEDERVVGEITDLINRVYATAESGLWVRAPPVRRPPKWPR